MKNRTGAREAGVIPAESKQNGNSKGRERQKKMEISTRRGEAPRSVRRNNKPSELMRWM